MAPTEALRLILVGMMGSGKTTVGRLLSAATGWPYVDNDELVEVATGLTARDLAAAGEAAVREAEAAALHSGLDTPPPCIVGTAAGTILDPQLREAIAAAGTVVWLRGRPETLAERAAGGAHRPWLDGDPVAWFKDTVADRDPLYASVAEIIVDVDDLPAEDVRGRILAALGRG